MRELTGGLYFGERKTFEEDGVTKAVDTLTYSEEEIHVLVVRGFDIAMKRRKKVNKRRYSNGIEFFPFMKKCYCGGSGLSGNGGRAYVSLITVCYAVIQRSKAV